MLCSSVSRRKRLTLDEHRETVVREMSGDERSRYYFGENVGLLVFRSWYPCIATPATWPICRPTIFRSG